ncbi:hypothetical protein BC830DRAFT_1132075 [Chytriomyces sp. MP71]|nr:hypothetical protein BC830DRAFT_1132075 [Chytriomyces sp. MP71]
MKLIETAYALKCVQPQPKKAGKVAPWHAAVATMAVFFVSGLIHEFNMLFVFLEIHPFGNMMAFFLLNGVLCIAQEWFQRATGYGKRWGRGWMWSLVGWMCTMFFLLLISNMFFMSVNHVLYMCPRIEFLIRLFRQAMATTSPQKSI